MRLGFNLMTELRNAGASPVAGEHAVPRADAQGPAVLALESSGDGC